MSRDERREFLKGFFYSRYMAGIAGFIGLMAAAHVLRDARIAGYTAGEIAFVAAVLLFIQVIVHAPKPDDAPPDPPP